MLPRPEQSDREPARARTVNEPDRTPKYIPDRVCRPTRCEPRTARGPVVVSRGARWDTEGPNRRLLKIVTTSGQILALNKLSERENNDENHDTTATRAGSGGE